MVLPKPVPVHRKYRILYTREEMAAMSKAGDVRAFFGLKLAGRRPNRNQLRSIQNGSNDGAADAAAGPAAAGSTAVAPAAAAAAPVRVVSSKPKEKAVRKINNWATAEKFPQLQLAVLEIIERHEILMEPVTQLNADVVQQEALAFAVPRQTLARMVPKFLEASHRHGVDLSDVSQSVSACTTLCLPVGSISR